MTCSLADAVRPVARNTTSGTDTASGVSNISRCRFRFVFLSL